MIDFKIYRWLHVMFGARSFAKNPNNHILLKGTSPQFNQMIKDIKKRGWIEEWPESINKEK